MTDKDGASVTRTVTITVKDKEKQPATPTKPDKGDKNNHASGAKKPGSSVKTGDNTNILLWGMTAVISLAGVITVLFFKRKRV